MKKIITIIVTLLFVQVAANAQLTGVSIEEAAGYRTVWKAPLFSGEIRYVKDEGYVLFGATDNRFEKSMASILLGEDKNSAILTLEDLQKIVKRKVKFSDLVVKGSNGKATTIIKGPLGEAAVFSTAGVAGFSHILWSMRNRFKSAKQAIVDFED